MSTSGRRVCFEATPSICLPLSHTPVSLAFLLMQEHVPHTPFPLHWSSPLYRVLCSRYDVYHPGARLGSS